MSDIITDQQNLPPTWEMVRLETVLDGKEGIKRGPWGGSVKKDMFVDFGYKVYEQGNVIANDFTKGNYFINEVKFQELLQFVVKPGDILVTGAGTIGKLAVVPSDAVPGIMNQALLRLRLDRRKVDKDFFIFIIKYFENTQFFSGYSHGAIQKNFTSVRSLRDIRIPSPPLIEQRKIAYTLSIVQKAIEKQEAIINTTTELKKALMQKLFTEGLNGEPQKEAEIGLVPESWKVCKIIDLYIYTSKPRTLNILDQQNIPFIPMDYLPAGDVEATNFEVRNNEQIKSGVYVENGDFLLAKITPSFENGKQGILSIPYPFAYATTEVIPIKHIESISNKYFLYYYLQIPEVRNFLAGKMEGSTGRQRLSKDILSNTLIPRPSLQEQNEISNILRTIDSKIMKAREKKAILNDLFKSLLHQLMAAQIRVNDIDFDNLDLVS